MNVGELVDDGDELLPLRLVTIDVGTGPVLEAVGWTIEAVLEIGFDVTLAVLMRVGELVDDDDELLPLRLVTIDVGTEEVLEAVLEAVG